MYKCFRLLDGRIAAPALVRMTYSRKRKEWMTSERGERTGAWFIGTVEQVRNALDGEWHDHGIGLSTNAACEWALPDGAVEMAIMSHKEGIAAYAAYRNDPAQTYEHLTPELRAFFNMHQGACLAALPSGREGNGRFGYCDTEGGYTGFSGDD